MATTTMRALPSAAEASDAEAALSHAFDLIERIGWAAKAAAETDGSSYPHPVTFETIGVLADFRASLNARIVDFQLISQRIDEAMFSIGTMRLEQARANA